jgi:general secretion pathway protein H
VRNSSTHPAATQRRAFTLIELLIVVVLLGIAGAMVIPQMGTVGALRAHGALRTIVSDITYAQSDAIAFQQPRAVQFDTASSSYRLIQVVGTTVSATNTMYDASNYKAGGRYVVTFDGNESFGGARISAVSFTGVTPSNTLIFDEMGTPVIAAGSNTPSTGGSVTVSTPDNTYVITIEAYTGRVAVRKTAGN